MNEAKQLHGSGTRTDLPQVFTAEQVAQHLGVTAWTVKNLHRVGRLRGFLIARKLRFSADAVRDYLADAEGGAR